MKDTTAQDGPTSGVEIVINGEPAIVAGDATLGTVLQDRGAPPRGVAVAVDGAVIPRGVWDSTALPQGTEVEIVTAVQGG